MRQLIRNRWVLPALMLALTASAAGLIVFDGPDMDTSVEITPEPDMSSMLIPGISTAPDIGSTPAPTSDPDSSLPSPSGSSAPWSTPEPDPGETACTNPTPEISSEFSGGSLERDPYACSSPTSEEDLNRLQAISERQLTDWLYLRSVLDPEFEPRSAIPNRSLEVPARLYDLRQQTQAQPIDPFDQKNCGNCKCPHCKSLKISCLTDEEMQKKLPGALGICTPSSCEVFLSKEQMCKPFGLGPDTSRPTLKPGEDLRAPIFKSAKSAFAFCGIKHERTHGCDDPTRCPNCGTEVSAFNATLTCLQNIHVQQCNPTRGWSVSDCMQLSFMIADTRKMIALNECLCKKRKPGFNVGYPKGTCDYCAAEAGLNPNQSKQDRDSIYLYCGRHPVL